MKLHSVQAASLSQNGRKARKNFQATEKFYRVLLHGLEDEAKCTVQQANLGKYIAWNRYAEMNHSAKNTRTHRRRRIRCMFPAHGEMLQATIIKTACGTKTTNFR